MAACLNIALRFRRSICFSIRLDCRRMSSDPGDKSGLVMARRAGSTAQADPAFSSAKADVAFWVSAAFKPALYFALRAALRKELASLLFCVVDAEAVPCLAERPGGGVPFLATGIINRELCRLLPPKPAPLGTGVLSPPIAMYSSSAPNLDESVTNEAPPMSTYSPRSLPPLMVDTSSGRTSKCPAPPANVGLSGFCGLALPLMLMDTFPTLYGRSRAATSGGDWSLHWMTGAICKLFFRSLEKIRVPPDNRSSAPPKSSTTTLQPCFCACVIICAQTRSPTKFGVHTRATTSQFFSTAATFSLLRVRIDVENAILVRPRLSNSSAILFA